MSRLYTPVSAFVDESGDVSTSDAAIRNGRYYTLAAIVVEDSRLDEVRWHVDSVRKRLVGAHGELKSVRLGSRTDRRVRFLRELAHEGWTAYVLTIDKSALSKTGGFAFVRSGYKAIHRIFFNRLIKSLPRLTLVVDQHGSTDFMKSFIRYFESKFPSHLFEESQFRFTNSRDEVLVGLADIVAGSVRRASERRPGGLEATQLRAVLRPPLLLALEIWPPERATSVPLQIAKTDSPHDAIVAGVALRAAHHFLQTYSASMEDFDRAGIAVLQQLLSLYQENPFHNSMTIGALRAIASRELGDEISDRAFRSKVIGRLRDEGLLIASGAFGLKIPATLAEYRSYIAHDHGIMLPLLRRIERGRTALKLADPELEVLEGESFRYLRDLLNLKQLPSE